MGHPEAKVAAVEFELRMYTHDILKAHHDKDYRGLAVFPVECYEHLRFVVVRLDYKGDILVEAIEGRSWGPGEPDVWALVWKGHMTLLVPRSAEDAADLLKAEAVLSVPGLGFPYFWQQRADQARTAPGHPVCRLCKPPRKQGASLEWDLVRKTTCLPQVGRGLAGGTVAPQRAVRPSRTQGGPRGLVLREFFAGTGRITAGWSLMGETALPPVELYEEPHLQKGYRAECDLSLPDVQRRYLEEVRAGGSTVHWIACPCTTFCDWNLQNGGTRTFQCPAGTPTAKESNGNLLSEFGAKLFEASLAAGGFPIAESSGTSGRYPKQWHLPRWQKIIQRPDVDFIELDMCAFGLQPVDGEAHHFYKHRTGLVFPHNPGLRRALLRLCPGVGPQHQHVALKGARQGTAVTRCTEAGAYSEGFVAAVLEGIFSTLVVEGVPGPQKPGGHDPSALEEERKRMRCYGMPRAWQERQR